MLIVSKVEYVKNDYPISRYVELSFKKDKDEIMDLVGSKGVHGITKNQVSSILGMYSNNSRSEVVMYEESLETDGRVMCREFLKPIGSNKYFALCYYKGEKSYSLIPVKSPRLLTTLKRAEINKERELEEHKIKYARQERLISMWHKENNTKL